MRDGWNRGDYRHHHNGVRHSSTRTTVNNREISRSRDDSRSRDYSLPTISM
jgi:hypothetical protein